MRWIVLTAALGLAGCATYSKAYNAIAVGPPGQTVYAAGECIGAVVNGVCNGTIQPQTAVHPICHGQMLNGQCTGPVF